MKKHFTLLIGSILISTSLLSQPQQNITLNLRNIGRDILYLAQTVDETHTITVCDTFNIQSDTILNIKKGSSKQPRIITLYGHSLNPINTVVGHDNFSLTIDKTQQSTPIQFTGDNAEGRQKLQELYAQRTPFYKYGMRSDFTQYPLDEDAQTMYENFKKMAQQEIDEFTVLKESGKIDNTFYIFAMNDCRLYYNMILSYIIFGDYMNNMEEIENMRPGFGDVWQQIYADVPLDATTYHFPNGALYAQYGLL